MSSHHLQKQFEAENLTVVGTPDVSEVHFHDGEPLRFKATFEVVPQIELGEYKGVEVPYQDPEVTEEESQPYARPNSNDSIETAEPVRAVPVVLNGTLRGPERSAT